jgi:predicted MFS family arabinose efflux permease
MADNLTGGVIYVIAFRRLQPRIGFGWATRVIAFIALITLAANLVVTKTRTKPGPARNLLELSAFKSVPYSLFTAGTFVALIGLYFPYFYIPVYCERIVGTSADFAFYLLAVVNAASFFGRIVPNLLADKVGSLNVLIPCTFITAALSMAWVGIKSVGGIVAFTIFYGFFSGTFLSLLPTVIASLSPDPRSYGTRMGMSFGIGSFGILIGNPIAGQILNVAEGKFGAAQYFAASTMFGGAVLFAICRLAILLENGNRRNALKTRLMRRPRLEEHRLQDGHLRNYSLRPQ